MNKISFKSILEEIKRNLGEAKLRHIEEEDNETKPENKDQTKPQVTSTGSPVGAPQNVPAGPAAFAPRAMSGGNFKPEAPSTGGAENKIAPSMSMMPKVAGLTGSSVGAPGTTNTNNTARTTPTPAAARPVSSTAAAPRPAASAPAPQAARANPYASTSDEIGGSAADLIRGDRARAAEAQTNASTSSAPAARPAARPAVRTTARPTTSSVPTPTPRPAGLGYTGDSPSERNAKVGLRSSAYTREHKKFDSEDSLVDAVKQVLGRDR